MESVLLFLIYTLQVITVNQTDPCFLNYTAGFEMWENCGIRDDYIRFALLGWEWISGGHFTLILVSIFTVFSYIKYQKAIYPFLTGILFLPISYFVFPDEFLSFAFVLGGLLVGILIWYAYLRQTKEY